MNALHEFFIDIRCIRFADRAGVGSPAVPERVGLLNNCEKFL